MKVENLTDFKTVPEQVWKTLMDFPTYPKWNPLLTSFVSGSRLELDAPVQATIHYRQRSPLKVQGKITGVKQGRYFSWSWNHGLGSWYYQEEHVYLLVQAEGSVRLSHEIYLYGFVTRFGRRDRLADVRASMERMAISLNEKLEKSQV